MRKILKIMPYLCILMITVFFVLIKDSSQKVEYYAFQDYERSSLFFNEDTLKVDENAISSLESIAKKNNVVLVKQFYDSEKDEKQIYFSCESLTELLEQKGISYKILKDESKLSFASTKKTGDINQELFIQDFLNNDDIQLYKFPSLIEKNVYIYGIYSIYYHEYENLEHFNTQISEYFNVPLDALTTNAGVLMGHSRELFIGMSICVFFLLLLYFVLIIFDLYKQSKKIGCLKLLGFSISDMTKVLFKKNILYIFVFSICLFIPSMIFLPNVDKSFMIQLFTTYGSLLLFTTLLSAIALMILCKNHSVSDIIKNSSVLQNIVYICNGIKIAILCFLFVFTCFIMETSIETYESSKILLNNEELLDYAVFSKIVADSSERNDTQKYLNLYNKIFEQDEIPYMYVDFRNYRKPVDLNTELEKMVMATVDKNYLVKQSLEIKDELGNKTNVLSNKMEYFLFPLSKKSIVNTYVERYEEKMNKLYNPLGISFDGEIYYYEDRDFNTYDIMNENIFVSSPIIRVINKGYPISYMEKATGIDVAGTGMTTALRFDVSGGKEEIYRKISKIVSEVGLEKTLGDITFTTYSDYLELQQSNLKNSSAILLVGLSISFSIYIFLLIQSMAIYIEIHCRRIYVKKSLGFKRKDIFKKLVLSNLILSLLVILILIPICKKVLLVDWFILGVLALVFFVIDAILTLCIVKVMPLNSINALLKGK